MTTRRGFLAGILSAGFAPAAVGSGILMPVRKIVLSKEEAFVNEFRDRITRAMGLSEDMLYGDVGDTPALAEFTNQHILSMKHFAPLGSIIDFPTLVVEPPMFQRLARFR